MIRLAGLFVLLVGMLLLQTSLSEGQVAGAAPCIESCERVVGGGHHVEESGHGAVVVDVRVPADHQSLVELSLVVLIAVLMALGVLTRPRSPAAGVAPPAVRIPLVRVSRAHAGRPCVLRL